jgi:serine/threonine protein phosphatase PrpC
VRRKNVNILDDIEIQDSIRETFIKLDENLAFELAKRKMYECGTTVVCAIITDEKIILANCGDSRYVLRSNGRIKSSRDHKPMNVGRTLASYARKKFRYICKRF